MRRFWFPWILALVAGCADRPAPAPDRAAEAPAPKQAAAPAAPAPAAKAAKAAPAEQDDEKIGLDLMQKETIGSLSIGAAEAVVAETAGRPGKKGKPEMSEALGVYVKSWTYPAAGLEVWMSAQEKKGPYRVLTLRIEEPSTLKTSKGIGIGSPVAEVEKVYPKNAAESGPEQLVAGSLYGGVLFEIADGAVSSIFLGAAAE